MRNHRNLSNALAVRRRLGPLKTFIVNQSNQFNLRNLGNLVDLGNLGGLGNLAKIGGLLRKFSEKKWVARVRTGAHVGIK